MKTFFNILRSSTGGVIATPPVETDTAKAAKHIQGYTASFSESSDSVQEHFHGTEMLGMKHGIALTIFLGGTDATMNLSYKLGRTDIGLYDANGITPLADLKAMRGGRDITALAYMGGTDNNKLNYLPDLLSGRNSETEIAPSSIEYSGLTDVDLISKANTFRWGYYNVLIGRDDFIMGTRAEGLVKLEQYVNETIAEGGHFHNFMHWHWQGTDNIPVYFEALKGHIDGQDVYSGSYSDIQEYQFIRDAVDTITYTNGVVDITYSKKYPNSPYHKITTPLWVELQLAGTALEGKDITSSNGEKIRKIGANHFAVAVTLDFTLTSKSITISETVTPVYINTTPPVVSITGNDITSDQPIKYHAYRKAKTDPYEINANIVERRTDTFETALTMGITLDTVNYDYYIGYITEDKISGVIQF